ncbi:MAG: sodium:solute symporter family transporter [Candidatus Brocadiia bacterium]
MEAIDNVVMGCFFALLFGVSAVVSRRRASKEQFFLAGRRLKWLYIGFALIAINVGARYVIGFAGVGYTQGALFGQYEVVSTLNLLVLVFFLLPLFRASGIYTMPQLLRHRYGESTHLIFSIIAIVSIFLTVPAGSALLSATLSELTGTNMWVYVAVLVTTCVVVTMWGGLTSVAYTDMLMGFVIIVGGVVVTSAALSHEAVGGLGGLVEKIGESKPELLTLFRQGGPIPWQAVFTGVFLIGLWFWCIDQTKMQIVLGARTLNDGRRGAMLLALLKFVTAFLVLTPGLCGRLIYPGLEKADPVYGMMLRDLVGPGVRGLVVAGLAAAVISTLMALLNAASSIFTNDVFGRMVSEETFDRHAIRCSRLFVLAAGGLTFGGVAIYARFEAVMTVLLKVYGLVAGPTLAAYLLGIFWRRATARGANLALTVGLVVSFGAEFVPHLARLDALYTSHSPAVVWLTDHLLWLGDVNHHYRSAFTFLFSCGLLMVASLLSAPPDPRRLERTTFAWYWRRRRELEARAATPDDHQGEPLKDPWYLDYRLWSAVMVALLLATWWVFGLARIWRGF